MIGEYNPPRDQTYDRGLEGLEAGRTRISRIDGARGQLWYRGYAIEDLATEATFEEVSYLVLRGDLPTRAELAGWTRELAAWRRLPPAVLRGVEELPSGYDLLSGFRTAVAAAAGAVHELQDMGAEAPWRHPARILTWTAGLAAAVMRRRDGLACVEPRDDLGYAAHFLWQVSGEEPDPLAARAFEVCLIVQAEHGIHAAALAALIVTSTRADLDSAVLAGIGALSGSRHGDATRPAFQMVRRQQGVEEARLWARQCLAAGYRFPGFGHRVYKSPDPRARLLEPHARALLARSGEEALWDRFTAIRDEVEAHLGLKGVYANVDGLTGLIYHPLGLSPDGFTIPFCLAIQTGWMAHCLEYLPHGRIVEPGAIYVAPTQESPS